MYCIKNSINIHCRNKRLVNTSYVKLIHTCAKPGYGPADTGSEVIGLPV